MLKEIADGLNGWADFVVIKFFSKKLYKCPNCEARVEYGTKICPNCSAELHWWNE